MRKALTIGLALLILVSLAGFCQAKIARSDLTGVWIGSAELTDGNGTIHNIRVFLSIEDDVIASPNGKKVTHFFGSIYLEGDNLPQPFDNLPSWPGLPFSGTVLNDNTTIMTANESLIRAKFSLVREQNDLQPQMQGFIQLTDNFPVNTATGTIYVRKARVL